MADGLTASERIVNDISTRAFLSLWTHPNPLGKHAKELCDWLVVCDHTVLIISVKDIKYKDTGDNVGRNRWIKSAITKSIDQNAGAERWLRGVEEVDRADGRRVTLPPHKVRQYLRLSISLGANRQCLTVSGVQGAEIVHICDESSLGVVFGLLDTITDFVDFFIAIESLLDQGTSIVFDGGGLEDLLAIYIEHDYSFEAISVDYLIIDNSVYQHFCESDLYAQLQEHYKQ